MLFNIIFLISTLPCIWLQAVIIPIFKVGARDDPSEYRFISLLCAPAKLFASILRRRIETWALSVNIFLHKQIGFCSDFSCMHHVLTLTTLIQQANNNSQY